MSQDTDAHRCGAVVVADACLALRDARCGDSFGCCSASLSGACDAEGVRREYVLPCYQGIGSFAGRGLRGESSLTITCRGSAGAEGAGMPGTGTNAGVTLSGT